MAARRELVVRARTEEEVARAREWEELIGDLSRGDDRRGDEAWAIITSELRGVLRLCELAQDLRVELTYAENLLRRSAWIIRARLISYILVPWDAEHVMGVAGEDPELRLLETYERAEIEMSLEGLSRARMAWAEGRWRGEAADDHGWRILLCPRESPAQWLMDRDDETDLPGLRVIRMYRDLLRANRLRYEQDRVV